MGRLGALWRAEAPAFPLWAPVFLGLGIQLWFMAPVEPAPVAHLALVAGFGAAALAFRRAVGRRPLLWAALGLVVLGVSVAGLRARIVAAPVLAASVDATVEGVIREISQTASGRPRVLLDDVFLFGSGPGETPARVRVALRKAADLEGLAPGMRVSIFARLGPPAGPVEPGGFDFRRMAWFDGLGAVGFARSAPAALEAGAAGPWRRAALALAALRVRIAEGFRAALPGERGAFAAAVTVGERYGVPKEANEALRAANLAHLLAISGLHMGLVTGLVFSAARLLLAAIPWTAAHWRTKRIAAIVALVAATGYLFLSGAEVATQRSWIMVAVALTAVLLDRPAITLRALAAAAALILLVAPESLLSVGFQMSFAATAAIVAGFEKARGARLAERAERAGRARPVILWLAALAATSLLAGLATAPYSAFHFNRMANYGLIANLAAVPAMGFWVAPFGLLAALLAPFGLEGWAVEAMGAGIGAILRVARFVAGLDGATSAVAAAPPAALWLVTFGGLCLCLGRALLPPVGALLAALGVALFLAGAHRPALLVAPDAKLLGALGTEGRALDRRSGEGFAARSWLQSDGDEADQKEAAARPGLERGPLGPVAPLANGWRVAVVTEERPCAAELAALCDERTLVLTLRNFDAGGGACRHLSGPALRAAGALAIDPSGAGLRVTTAAEAAGDRFWTRAGGDAGED